MSYLRLDNRELEHLQKHTIAPNPPRPPISHPPSNTRPSTMLNIQEPKAPPKLEFKLPSFFPLVKKPIYIRGINPLIKQLGQPDVTDKEKGGIAIWARDTLQKRGYKFLHRVEIIDEAIPSLKPVKHFSNIYIWVKIPLNQTQEHNVLSLSSDFYYDQGKDLLIVRSDSLDTAVAQASLIALYSSGRLTYYDIVSSNMHFTYYHGVNRKKTRKTLYTILNNIVKKKAT
jgi:hypothetical protein